MRSPAPSLILMYAYIFKMDLFILNMTFIRQPTVFFGVMFRAICANKNAKRFPWGIFSTLTESIMTLLLCPKKKDPLQSEIRTHRCRIFDVK